jgi:lipopolysaccharide export system permease protein
MRILTRYIGRDVLWSTLLLFVALIGLFTFFDLINEMRDVGRGGYTISTALMYVTLHMPSRVYELFPVAALIGTLFAVSQLVSNSEFTVMRASGASMLQVGWAVVRVGIPLAIATFVAGEYVAPPAERLAQTLRAAALGNVTGVVAQQFESGFWFKQDYTFVNIRTVLADMTLVGVRIYEFDRDLRLTTVRSAESGRFVKDEGRWKLEQVKVTEIGRDSAKTSSEPTWMWSSVLQPSILTVYQVAPERLALSTLYDNIRVLGDNAQKTSRFEIAFWSKVLYPVAVLVMMMLALPFAQFQRRQGGVGFRLFAGTMLGLAFWLIERLFSYLGVLNDWTPIFSAAFPLGVFVCVAVAMQYYIERR